jgi:hypothetical protein
MEAEPCPVPPAPNDGRPSNEPLEKLAFEGLKSLNELVTNLRELVSLFKSQQEIEGRRNDLLTELLAHYQVVSEKILTEPSGGPVDDEGRPIMDMDGRPIWSG